MTTHSGDAPMVTLLSNTSTQWRTAIHATVAVSRFRKTLSLKSDRQQEGPQSEFQRTQSRPMSEDDDTYSLASYNEGANQAAQLDPKARDKTLEDKNPEVVLKLVRDELVKQLDAYGLVLVLLAGITFVAILQPPGSFDNLGKLQKSPLVSLFMLLATLSFFIACTALGAVMVGCAQLFRPFFHPKLTQIYEDAVRQSQRLPPVETGLCDTTETLARRGFRNWLQGCWEISPRQVAFDNIDVLANLCVENVYRIRCIRIYLGAALVLCIAAYICGALAVMVINDHQRYMLVGAIGAGGVILIIEICITVSAAMKPESKSIDRSLQPRLQKQLRDLTWRYGGHPDTQSYP